MPEVPKGATVTIISETEMTTFPVPGQTKVVRAITFRYADLPPLTVYIDKEKDTPDLRKAAIRERLKQYEAEKPYEFTL